MLVMLGAVLLLCSPPLAKIVVAHPGRTILPVYAGTLPIASAVNLPIPLPTPFDTASSLLGGFTVIACVLHLCLYRSGRVPTVPVAAWTLFLAWSTLTTFWALNVNAALRAVVIAVPLMVLMFLVGVLSPREIDLDLLRLAIVLGGAAVGAYATFLLVTGAGFPAHSVDQRFSLAASAQDTNPNILAATLLLPYVLSLERVVFGASRWWRPTTWRLISAGACCLTFVAIVLTASRGGIATAVVLTVATLYFATRVGGGAVLVARTIAGFLVACLVVGLAVFITVTIGPQRFVQRLETRLVSGPIQRIARRQVDASGRSEIWRTGVLACQAYCAGGAALGNFGDAYSLFYPFADLDRDVGSSRPAHNMYLSLAVEVGAVGLTILGLALVTEWRTLSSRKMQLVAPGLKAGLLGILVVNIFEGAVWFKYFWLVFVLIRAAEGAVAAVAPPKGPRFSPAARSGEPAGGTMVPS
jgi:hypothetical protein